MRQAILLRTVLFVGLMSLSFSGSVFLQPPWNSISKFHKMEAL